MLFQNDAGMFFQNDLSEVIGRNMKMCAILRITSGISPSDWFKSSG